MRRLKTFGALSRSHPFGPAGGMIAISGFNGGTRYEETNAGPAGSTSMSRVIVFRLDALPAIQSALWGRGNQLITARGWICFTTAANNLHYRVTTAALLSVDTPAYTMVAGDLGKVFVFFSTFDGITLRGYQQTAGVVAEIGGGSAAVGYTGPDATDDFKVANRQDNARVFTAGRLVAMAGSDTTVWSVAQMQAIADDVRANYRIAGATPGELIRYNARNCFPPGNWIASAGTDLSAQGANFALVTRTSFPPVFR